MNSQNILGIARHNKGVKGWYLRKTFLGKRMVTKALESEYGTTERVLPNGVRKLVAYDGNATKNNTYITYISPDKLQPCRRTLITYDKNGNRIAFYSEGVDPNDKHRKTVINITDAPKLGRRDYLYTVKRFCELIDENQKKVYKWITERVENKTVIKNSDGTFTSEHINKDCVNLTHEKTKKTFTLA